MQSAVVPESTCSTLDRARRQFIWGSTESERKLSLVKWETICQPKENGGLGMGRSKDINRAFFTKLAWRILMDSSSTWTNLMRAKYLKYPASDLNWHAPQNASRTWRELCKVCGVLKEGIRKVIGNGKTTKFWSDDWLGNEGRLMDYAVGVIPEAELVYSVADYVDEDGEWEWEKLNYNLAPHVRAKIATIPPPNQECGEDEVHWKWTASGKLTVNSVQLALASEERGEEQQIWKLVWKWPGPERIRTFLWLVAHGKLLTNSERRRRHLTDLSLCSVCRAAEEDIFHVLRDCPVTIATWAQLHPSPHPNFFTAQTVVNWLCSNLDCSGYGTLPRQWSRTFGVTCWMLWKWRNSAVFQEEFSRAPNVKSIIVAQVEAIARVEEVRNRTFNLQPKLTDH